MFLFLILGKSQFIYLVVYLLKIFLYFMLLFILSETKHGKIPSHELICCYFYDWTILTIKIRQNYSVLFLMAYFQKYSNSYLKDKHLYWRSWGNIWGYSWSFLTAFTWKCDFKPRRETACTLRRIVVSLLQQLITPKTSRSRPRLPQLLLMSAELFNRVKLPCSSEKDFCLHN